MKIYHLPSQASNTLIEKIAVDKNITLGTSIGMVKPINEDALGMLLCSGSKRFCIADGHWGASAAEHIRNSSLKSSLSFPTTTKKAKVFVSKLEEQLFEMFGAPNMDEAKDFTPEASFIVVDISQNKLRIVAYGDCRMLLVRNKNIVFQLETAETWLGAFSHLGLRKRQSASAGATFQEIAVQQGDTVLLFTDGVDQCIYEKPTVSPERIASLVEGSSSHSFNSIMDEVFTHGAEDNASLAVVRIG